ncbi:unnamed protein product [Durusdinium trenchii]|uniref:tRNA(Phe) (4-demethylwyosine(37)-C(7)) aminocarboxypropyltransferase (PhTYW2) (tRNA wyosine derivatives biosynthesis protein Taw2) n=2 Tax=Durusdinium trenchii TaxID=1381693 RepID=A0ABP0QN12_9DINO
MRAGGVLAWECQRQPFHWTPRSPAPCCGQSCHSRGHTVQDGAAKVLLAALAGSCGLRSNGRLRAPEKVKLRASSAEVGSQKRKFLPKHQMMVDVAVLAPSQNDGEEDLLKNAEVLLSQKHVRSVAVFEPRGVGLDTSRVGIRHLAGDPDLEIVYKECGFSFRLDLSQRLSRLSRCQGGVAERGRLRGLVQPTERVLVLGSGIGLSSCIVGAGALEVWGLEKDEVKHGFAEANIIENELEGKVRSIARDPLDVNDLGGFHRICAFLKFQPVANLKPLMDVLLPGGTLHYYNHETKEEFHREPLAVLDAFRALSGRPMQLTWRGRVPRKSIARDSYRVGMDLRIA